MSVTVTHRQTCRLCDAKDVELVVKLDPIPLSENYCQDSETGKKAARYPVDLYMCKACGHVQQLDVVDSKSLWESYTYYSGEAKGMPEEGIAAGTRWEDVPEDWICPDCGTTKSDFQMSEVG